MAGWMAPMTTSRTFNTRS